MGDGVGSVDGDGVGLTGDGVGSLTGESVGSAVVVFLHNNKHTSDSMTSNNLTFQHKTNNMICSSTK